MEEWRPVKGWESLYKVSDKGNVMSLDRVVIDKNGAERQICGKVLTKTTNNGGYYYVHLYKNNVMHVFAVHRLVAEAFIQHDDSKNVVHHKDHNRTNNCVGNLEWVTQQQNIVESVTRRTYRDYKDSHNLLGTHKCLDCGRLVRYKSVRCKPCATKYIQRNYKSHKLTSDEVKNALVTNHGNFTQAAKAFGMTDNALRKWCKKYGLPTHSKDWRH